MKSSIDICNENVTILFELINTITNLIGLTPLARADRENIANFEINYKNFKKRTSSNLIDIEPAISSAKNAAIHAEALATGIQSREIYNETAKHTANDLKEAAREFINQIDSGDEFIAPYNFSSNGLDPHIENPNVASSVSFQEKQFIELQAKLRSDIEAFERDIAKGSDEIDQLKQKSTSNYKTSNEEILELMHTVESLKSNISDLHKNMQTESDKAAKISDEANEYSKKAHSQIDELLGHTASKVLLVDYANTAEAEKKSADRMRNASLACMALTGIVICFALYESLASPLDWKQSILKVFTAIALSVPAAYLARESAKHRNQEHINRRISLDLRAITPYIATLPSEEQNKIKSEVASKIFGVQENGNTPPDNYPINIQELVKSMIEKIPTPK
ncbi:hypothetical protein [Pseudomonas sp. NFX224]|uniref:hypothetical protein n=1 Tax=Pseudomonas sp. NFX224 TaxID=3402862 RepID=UPI003AFA731C